MRITAAGTFAIGGVIMLSTCAVFPQFNGALNNELQATGGFAIVVGVLLSLMGRKG